MSDDRQRPIPSPFGYRSTAKEVIADADVAGKTVLVTGGYSGLGLETVRAFAEAGAKVIVPARRPEVAREACADIEGEVRIEALDLGDPASINAFADRLLSDTPSIDIMINNAAIMACPLARDARGFESQFAVNHLGHFHLTAHLFPMLKAGHGARVVCLSSSGHGISSVDLDDPHYENRDYDKWIAYGQAKSANALFALELDKRGAEHRVHAYSVDPGGIKTPLQRHLSMEEQVAMGWYDADGNLNEMFKTPEQGASTSVWAATSELLADHGGVYCAHCTIAAPHEEGQPRYVGVYLHVRDADLAARLWNASEEMTGIRFLSQTG